MMDILTRYCTITESYRAPLLQKLRGGIKGKKRACYTKVLASWRTRAQSRAHIQAQSAPDLAPFDFHLLPTMESFLWQPADFHKQIATVCNSFWDLYRESLISVRKFRSCESNTSALGEMFNENLYLVFRSFQSRLSSPALNY